MTLFQLEHTAATTTFNLHYLWKLKKIINACHFQTYETATKLRELFSSIYHKKVFNNVQSSSKINHTFSFRPLSIRKKPYDFPPKWENSLIVIQ